MVSLATTCRVGRLPLCMPSLSDKSGVEAMVHKMFTVEQSLCFFVQKLATVSWLSGISLDTSHVCGVKNTEAGFLSRWDGPCFPGLLKPVRVMGQGACPADAKLLCKPPLRAAAGL